MVDPAPRVIAMRRCLAGLALGVLGAVLLASPAAAHASLLGSTPAPGAVLERAPEIISLRFSEPVDILDDSIRLLDSFGASVDTSPVRRDGGDETMAVDLDPAGTQLTGTYVVAWQAVSADSHPVRGAFTFSVGEPSATDPSLIEDVLSGSGGAGGPELALGVGRWASYGGIAVLVGGLAALAICAPAASTSRRAHLMIIGGAIVGALGTLVLIGAQAAGVGGALDPDSWSTVLGSRAGRWWAIRLVLLVVAAVLVWVLRRALRRPGVLTALAAYGAALLVVVAAGGHAVTGAAVAIGFVATVVHLAAMALWFGGLATIVAVVGRPTLWAALIRFSPLALGAVVALALTGVVNAWRQLDSVGALTDTSYGRWLIVKLVVVPAVVAVAAFSRSTLRADRPALPAGRPLSTVGAAAHPPSTDRLRRSVLVEVAGMVVVLAATAGLVSSPPPRALAGGGAEPITVVAVRDDWSAQIDLVPAATGGTTMHVTLATVAGGEPEADEITVSAVLPSEQLGPIDIPVVPAGDNHVTTDDADFPVPGLWEITVTARFGDFDQIVLTTSAEVR